MIDVRNHDDARASANLADLAKVPAVLHSRLLTAGLTAVYVGAGPVTGLDDLGHLKGRRPRGWPTGFTWDVVRGCYDRERKAVVAGTGEGGSSSVALHEYGHAAAHLLGLETDAESIAWHQHLYPNLGKYLQQGGPGSSAGVEELLAESFAVYWSRGGGEAVFRWSGSVGYARWFERKMKEITDGTATTA